MRKAIQWNALELEAFDRAFRIAKAGNYAPSYVKKCYDNLKTDEEKAAFDQGYRKGKRSRVRAERSQVLRDLGLTRVRGSRGGIYWE